MKSEIRSLSGPKGLTANSRMSGPKGLKAGSRRREPPEQSWKNKEPQRGDSEERMSFTNLKYHIVFSTKDRRPFLTSDTKPRLIKYVGGIIRNLKGTLIEADGPEDHLHLAVGIHPSTSVSEFVRTLKSNCTAWVHETFAELREFHWQDEYSAFTVSHSQLPAVVEYIRRQVEHHHKMSFTDELKLLLLRHDIEFDERYIQ
jgi:REP element-mobilizing transposase RayT